MSSSVEQLVNREYKYGFVDGHRAGDCSDWIV